MTRYSRIRSHAAIASGGLPLESASPDSPSFALARRFTIVWLAAFVFTLALAGYFNFPIRSNEYDALSFARTAERNGPMYSLFHPHHLLYPSVGWIWYRLGPDWSGTGRALDAMQAGNAVLGATGVVAMFLLALLATRQTIVAFASAVGLAASYAYWNSSIEVSARMVGVVLLVAAGASALWAVNRRVASWLLPGLFLGLAGLGHQTNVLLSPALFALALAQSGRRMRERVMAAVLVIAVGAGVAIGGYAVVGRGILRVKSWPVLVRWMSSYLLVGSRSESAEGVDGIVRNPFEGRVFPSADMTQFERAKFGWRKAFFGVNSKRLSLAEGLNAGQFRLLVFWLGVGYCGALVLVFLPRNRELRPGLVLGVGWLASFVPFFYWWEPGNLQFWVTSLPAVWLLFAVAAGALGNLAPRSGFVWRAAVGVITLALPVALGWGNLTGKVVRSADVKRSYYYRTVAMVEKVWKSGDLLVVGGWNAMPLFLEYRTEYEFVSVYAALRKKTGTSQELAAALRKRLTAAAEKGRRVLCLGEVLVPASDKLGVYEKVVRSGDDPVAAVLEGVRTEKLIGAGRQSVHRLTWQKP